MTTYLDNHASTPVDPRVLDAMLPMLGDRFGNSGSIQHPAGQAAAAAVESARSEVAALFGADRRDVVFCAGATEANNLAIKGAAGPSERKQIVSCVTEHPAVLEPLAALAARGYTIDLLPVDRCGQLDLAQLAAKVSDRTLIVSVMSANNEIGTLHPVGEIAEIAHRHGALFHTDAAQAAGHVTLDCAAEQIDLLSISGHKLYAPQGTGALIVAAGIRSRLAPLVHGGGQERGLRSGTVNAPGAVALGAACVLARETRPAERQQIARLRDRLANRLLGSIDDAYLNGPPLDRRHPGNLNIRIAGVDSDALIAHCPQLAFSAGSACATATSNPSHVLRAIGLTADAADESIRLGIGRFNTDADIDTAADILADAVAEIRRRQSTLPAEPALTR